MVSRVCSHQTAAECDYGMIVDVDPLDDTIIDPKEPGTEPGAEVDDDRIAMPRDEVATQLVENLGADCHARLSEPVAIESCRVAPQLIHHRFGDGVVEQGVRASRLAGAGIERENTACSDAV